MDIENLIQKYNIPVPRYTSYPTVPYWGQKLDNTDKLQTIISTNYIRENAHNGISIYIHLPYCEKLCTFCACTRVITKNHDVEDSYIQAVLSEWKMYLDLFDEKPNVREIHLGGGTPTFFAPQKLNTLLQGILKTVNIHPQHEFSFEAHPGVTNVEHLEELYELGFRRVSFGIQDFDTEVQKTINRKNTFETVKHITTAARNIGYKSINYDLVYGLPKQKLHSVTNTINLISELCPDRIAFYSYAHVPWKMKTQRLFSEEDLPTDKKKRELYEKGKELLKSVGYFDIGLDHFSLKNDELYLAHKEERLHRNFMGYNTTHTKILIGLGASSISDFDNLYIQNEKDIAKYEKNTLKNNWAFDRSYILSEEDYNIKQAILSIICKRKLHLSKSLEELLSDIAKRRIKDMQKEGLIEIKDSYLYVTELGMVFLRNICSILDKKLEQNTQITFSKSI